MLTFLCVVIIIVCYLSGVRIYFSNHIWLIILLVWNI